MNAFTILSIIYFKYKVDNEVYKDIYVEYFHLFKHWLFLYVLLKN